MNNKILISIKIPYIEHEFDVFIPEEKKVGNIKNEIVKLINEEYPNVLPISSSLSFYERTTGELIKNDMYAKNCIKHGSHLILI